jgi:flavorubredoxin
MKILVVYYSMYGHVLQLARAVAQGAESVAGVDVMLRRVAEFDNVIQKTGDNEFIVKVVSSKPTFLSARSTISVRPPESSSAHQHDTAT